MDHIDEQLRRLALRYGVIVTTEMAARMRELITSPDNREIARAFHTIARTQPVHS